MNNIENFISYKSSSPAGDCISFLAGIRQMWVETGKKGVLYQRLDMPGAGHQDSIHPFSNSYGEPIAMPKSMFELLRPLVLSQEYMEDYLVYEGQNAFFDFDLIRMERFTNQPKGSLNRWFNYVFPQMTSDLSKKWIEVEPIKTEQIVINFTQRYRNHIVSYAFLKNYQDKIIFAGIKEERDLFCQQHGLDIPLLEVKDFLELARIITGCKFFMGNQSMCFQLAEAQKVPRILEVFNLMPNVIPIGEHAYDYYIQSACEFYFEKLLNNER